jgi:pimeloyl-ACP methyl ester carboxylesterase
MEPRIQYAKTSDGVSIAFSVVGDGAPLIIVPNPPWSNIQLAWQNPYVRIALERTSARWKLVQYDGRGSGLSQRKVTDVSLGAHVLDLEAVTGHLRLSRLALFGVLAGGPIAIAYSALHPERVSHLILWCSLSRVADVDLSPQAKGADHIDRPGLGIVHGDCGPCSHGLVNGRRRKT